MEKAALLVIDMEKGFDRLGMPLMGSPKLYKVISTLETVIAKGRAAGIPVIYVVDSFQPAEANIDIHLRHKGPHCIEGTGETDIFDPIKPREGDFVVGKRIYDGFLDTRLDTLLRELGVRTTFVSGIYTNACVQHTLMGAFFRGYKAVLLKDCTTCPKEEDYQYAIRYMQEKYDARVMTSDEFAGALEQTATQIVEA